MLSRTRHFRSSVARHGVALAICWLLSGAAGCALPWEKKLLLDDKLPNIDSVQGPGERGLRNFLRGKQDDPNADLSQPLIGTDEYNAANELYEAGQFEEAEGAFKKLSKGKKFKHSDIREDALFMWGESAFEQQKFAKSHDAYAELLRDYPSTRHLDTVSQRLFKIAMIWLDHPQVAQMSEIQQVNLEEPRQKLPAEQPPEKSATPVFIPNLTDKTRPLFDTEGNAVAALRAIWLHDTTGPLADDALMLAASHYARRGNFLEADHLFSTLREQYPTSPHLQQAFELGSHVKLMSYQGPAYDVKSLEEAEQLKEATLRLYGDTGDKERLKEELAKIEDQKALQLWDTAQFYLKKNRKTSASVYLHLLVDRYGKTRLAEPARKQLAELGPEYASGRPLLNPLPPEKSPSRLSKEGREAASRWWWGAEEEPPAGGAPRTAPTETPAEDEPEVDPYDPSVVEKEGTPPRSLFRRSTPKDSESAGDVEAAGSGDAKPRSRWSPPRLLPFGGDQAKPLPESADAEEAEVEEAPAGKVSF